MGGSLFTLGTMTVGRIFKLGLWKDSLHEVKFSLSRYAVLWILNEHVWWHNHPHWPVFRKDGDLIHFPPHKCHPGYGMENELGGDESGDRDERWSCPGPEQ